MKKGTKKQSDITVLLVGLPGYFLWFMSWCGALGSLSIVLAPFVMTENQGGLEVAVIEQEAALATDISVLSNLLLLLAFLGLVMFMSISTKRFFEWLKRKFSFSATSLYEIKLVSLITGWILLGVILGVVLPELIVATVFICLLAIIVGTISFGLERLFL